MAARSSRRKFLRKLATGLPTPAAGGALTRAALDIPLPAATIGGHVISARLRRRAYAASRRAGSGEAAGGPQACGARPHTKQAESHL